MHLIDLLDKARRLYPAKRGIICYEGEYTYEETWNRVLRLASHMYERGIKEGSHVAIVSYNCHIFLEAYYACALLGSALVPINYRLSPNEVEYILDDSETVFLIFHSDFKDKVEKWLEKNKVTSLWIGEGVKGERVQPYEEALLGQKIRELFPGPGDDWTAQIYYTSGTTGRPKGVMLSHRNCWTHALAAVAELKLTDEDVWIHVAPMFHLADAWATWAITWACGTHVMVKQFDPLVVLKTMQDKGVTITNMIPTMLNLLVKHPEFHRYSFPRLRVMLSGGAPIAPEVVKQIMEGFKCDYIQTYGMTETSPYLTVSILKEHLKRLSPEEQFRYKAKTGREFMCVSLRVVREDGTDVTPDEKEVGEIIVRGDSVTKGYWKLPEETEKAFKDGWLYTGDLAVMDSEGYVNIVDRKKDMIITGGENVYSTEVENVLYQHPKILEAAVFGIPHEKWGEAVHAAVVPKPGEILSEEEVIQHCKERLAHYKAPKGVTFLKELPRTGSGKIYKKGLRDQFWKGRDRQVG